jgi:hypothetical protein
MADMTASEAATFTRGRCLYTPQCWLTGSLPGVTPRKTAIQISKRFKETMKTAIDRICQLYGLDFPVHLGRLLHAKNTGR